MKQLSLFDGIDCKPLSPEEKREIQRNAEERRERAFLNAIKERSEKLEIWLKKGMSIDRQKTFDEKHYWVEDLPPKTHKKVLAVCKQCGKGRWVIYEAYHDLCISCAKIGENNPMFGKHHTEETIKKIRKSHLGENLSEESHKNMSESHIGRKPTEESRIKCSCTMQGISVEEFNGFTRYGKYCPKFNETLKERIRDKYERKCVLCGMNEEEHIKKYGRKMSIHHVDYNKQCGCDGNECRLVPLCSVCHAKTSAGQRSYWEEVVMRKVLEIFPDIDFDSPQTNLEDFYTTPQEMQHKVKISNLVKSIISQCVNYPPKPHSLHQPSIFDF